MQSMLIEFESGWGWEVAGGGRGWLEAAGGGVGATRSRDLPPYDNLK